MALVRAEESMQIPDKSVQGAVGRTVGQIEKGMSEVPSNGKAA